MVLRIRADSLDELPEVYREHATEDAGTFLVDVGAVDGWGIENGVSLRKALTDERTASGRTRGDLKALRDVVGDDTTLDSLRDLLEKAQRVGEDWTPGEKVAEQIEDIKRKLTDKHGVEKTAMEKQLAAAMKEIEALAIEQAATAAISKAKGDVDLLLPLIQRNAFVDREGGRPVGRIRDGEGAMLTRKAGSTDPMGLEEFVVEVLRKKHPNAFAADGKHGAGSGGSDSAPKGGSGVDFSKMSASEKVKYAHQQNAAKT